MDLARAETAHGQLWRHFQKFLETYEYFVLPTTQVPAFDVKTPYPTAIAEREIRSATSTG
jgi:amidase